MVALTALLISTTAIAAQQTATDVRYGRDIRPILADRCFRCHGPDQAQRQADLRLDRRDAALAARDGLPAIAAGAPERSELYRRIRHADDAHVMPPPDSGKPRLRDAEVKLIERWIRAGAPYEPHWAFQRPRRPQLPHDDRHPIDAFLSAAQQARGATPAPSADPATEARRLFLVLTGLPPTPAELDAYLADASADAYEQLVDRLLTEEPYRTRHAEHLAGIWLDAGRYADTSGIHMDAGRQAWLWRDWLVQALRGDQPFDQFVVEQLAGDLLPDATPSQRVATGFLRNHVTTDEGGAIDAEYLVEYAAERTATVGSVFLGLTVGCARCHDHKYDPISQRDYYRLFSFFNNNEEPGLYSQSRDANRALEPFLTVPNAEQQQRSEELRQAIDEQQHLLDHTSPTEQREFRAFLRNLQQQQQQSEWSYPVVEHAHSQQGATMTIDIDGSVLASGENPAQDTHVLMLRTDATDQRWLCLEALPDASLHENRVGRADNGNAVLSHVRLEARPVGSGAPWQSIRFHYAIADVEQPNNDFAAANVLTDDSTGWAVAAFLHPPGPRAAMLLSDRPFGYDGGTELRLTLAYQSPYERHVFGRVRIATSAGGIDLGRFPVATSVKHVVGPFAADDRETLYRRDFGPEQVAFDRQARFGDRRWRFDAKWNRPGTHELAQGQNVHYVAQRFWLATARTCEVALGSDDGFVLFVDGKQVAERRVDRGAAVDQDRVSLELAAGPHELLLKIVNTGGASGFALRHVPSDDQLSRDLCLALLPTPAAAHRQRIALAYRERSPHRRAQQQQLESLQQQQEQLDQAVPRAMVMRERDEARATFVLMRGEYAHPDKTQPIERQLPELFGPLPNDLPRNRLGLARWLVSDRNPLLLRVAVNRLWEFVFGAGIVTTSEDFGHQGAWPSHPDLLDWLATEFRARDHSMREMLRLMVTSAAFRRSSRVASTADRDPANQLLTWFPRRRLTAEAIRDQALYVAGLLVEQVGGPSVKPYQPPGLWREVAMVQSNTRNFERDDGQALWRRSLYTYWKRACPPPNLLTFDAPTREFCTIRRSVTNTPLQALVLWNDEQFVEAARCAAQRALADHEAESDRIAALYRRTTGRHLSDHEFELAAATLTDLRQRYRSDPAAANALLATGTAPLAADLEPTELAAFTLLASAFFDLDATLYID